MGNNEIIKENNDNVKEIEEINKQIELYEQKLEKNNTKENDVLEYLKLYLKLAQKKTIIIFL